ncbi:eukaryotic translation initiation factor 4E [Tilletiaria anomala UBC 951]|uniref:Eukaryotic translation initiation factor 4E n=1 Tax=Tilletiaria anomala (strain ATCC 24038 / CBS 436.72 / UBC 951) TaxID=1037660 RepID=A0A066WI49_TILAU|nr:eukaryotic translation initiation factor 4E [Tilletiaria anomala UBC 951]KDN52208.1 eukaryotic translation initiation factor 4E [Tilletiaria anomala UBC 951]
MDSASAATPASNNTSQLPPNAAAASKLALDSAMAAVSNGAAPKAGLSGRSQQSANGSASAENDTTAAASTTSTGKSAAGDESKEEGELSNDSGVDVDDAVAKNRAASASDMRTVFEDPENFNVKHPLASRWTLWFDNPSQRGMANMRGSKDSWGEDLNKVVDVDSVEEFWGLYHNIIPPSQLPAKANYYLFKEPIKPMWEDPANAKGGKWSVQFPREKSKSQIDNIWLYTMLSAIGETLDTPFPSGTPRALADGPEDELISGVLLAARPNFYRVAIWTRRSDQETEEIGRRLMDIGKNFKVNVLGLKLDEKVSSNYGTEIEFQSHTESEKKRGKKTVI